MTYASVVLPRPGRTVQQDVIERLAALARGRDRHVEVLFDPSLPDVVGQRARAQARLYWASSSRREELIRRGSDI